MAILLVDLLTCLEYIHWYVMGSRFFAATGCGQGSSQDCVGLAAGGDAHISHILFMQF
jgi:hypothetical protein